MAAACRYDDGAVAGAGAKRSVSGNVHVDDVLVAAVAVKRMVLLRPRSTDSPTDRCIPANCYGLQPGATWPPRPFCAPSSVDELAAAAVAGRCHSVLHDELSCGQWEAVDRRHRLCIIRLDSCWRRRLPTVVACYIPGGLLR